MHRPVAAFGYLENVPGFELDMRQAGQVEVSTLNIAPSSVTLLAQPTVQPLSLLAMVSQDFIFRNAGAF